MRSREEFRQRGSMLELIASALVISLLIGCWPIPTLADGQSAGGSSPSMGSPANTLITPSATTSSSARGIKRASQQRQPLVGAPSGSPEANGMAPFFSIKDGKTSARRIQQQQQQQVAPIGQRGGSPSPPLGQRGSGQGLQNSQTTRQNELENQSQLMDGTGNFGQQQQQFQSESAGAEPGAFNQLAPMSNGDDADRQQPQWATGSLDQQQLPAEAPNQLEDARSNSSAAGDTQAGPIRQTNRLAGASKKHSAGVKAASRNGSQRAPSSPQQQQQQQPSSLSMSLDGMIVNSRPRATTSSGAGEQPARGVKSSQRQDNRWDQQQQQRQQQQQQQGARLNSPPPPPSTTMRSVSVVSGANAIQSGTNSRRVPFSGAPFSSPASKGQRTRPKASNQFGGFSTASPSAQAFESGTQTMPPQQAANQVGRNQMTQSNGAAANTDDQQQQQKLTVISLDGEPQVNMNDELMSTVLSSLNNMEQNGAQIGQVGGSASSESSQPDGMNRVTTTRLPNGDMLMRVISSDDNRARQMVMITRDSLDSLQEFADNKQDQQEIITSTGATFGDGQSFTEASVSSGEQPPTATSTSSRASPVSSTTPVSFATSVATTQTPTGGAENLEPTTATIRAPAAATTTTATTTTTTTANTLLDGDDSAAGSGADTFREVSIQQTNGTTTAGKQRDQVGDAGGGQVGAKKANGQAGTKTRSKVKVGKQVVASTELSGPSQSGGQTQSPVSRPKAVSGVGGSTSGKTKQKKLKQQQQMNSSGQSTPTTTRLPTNASKRTKSPRTNQQTSGGTSSRVSTKTGRKQSAEDAPTQKQPDSTQAPTGLTVTTTGQTNGQQLPARQPPTQMEPVRFEAPDAMAAPDTNRGPTSGAETPSEGGNSRNSANRNPAELRGELDRQLDQMERANGAPDTSNQPAAEMSFDNERARPDRTPAISELDGLRAAIPGEPIADYPIHSEPPKSGSSFQCQAQSCPGGYYADPSSRCQVFHVCQQDGRMDTFLCPNGTIFSQQHFVCVWWWQVDCSQAAKFYELNDAIYCNSMTLPAVADANNRGSQPRITDNNNDDNQMNRENGFTSGPPRPTAADGATTTTNPTTASARPRGDGASDFQPGTGPSQNSGLANRTSESANDSQNETDMNQQQQQQLELLSRRAA